jgi:hypothetical protein
MCNLVVVYGRQSSILKIGAARSSEISVKFHRTTRRHIPEDRFPAFLFWSNFVIKSFCIITRLQQKQKLNDLQKNKRTKKLTHVQIIATQSSKMLFMPKTYHTLK